MDPRGMMGGIGGMQSGMQGGMQQGGMQGGASGGMQGGMQGGSGFPAGVDAVTLARKWIDGFWNTKDRNAAQMVARELMLPDVVLHDWALNTGTVNGIDSALSIWDRIHLAFPDLNIKLEQAFFAGGNDGSQYLVIRYIALATHTGPGYGAPSNKPVSCPGISVARVVGGKTAEEWDANDRLGLLTQMGFANTLPQDIVQAFGLSAPSMGTGMSTTGMAGAPGGGISGGGITGGVMTGVTGSTSGMTGGTSGMTGGTSGMAVGADFTSIFNRFVSNFWNTNDRATAEAALRELVLPTVKYHGIGLRTGTLTGHEAALAEWQRIRTAFPTLTVKLERVVASPDMQWFASHFTVAGAHSGPNFGNPTGRQIYTEGNLISRVENGKIAEEILAMDRARIVLRDMGYGSKVPQDLLQALNLHVPPASATGVGGMMSAVKSALGVSGAPGGQVQSQPGQPGVMQGQAGLGGMGGGMPPM